jgi:ABC-type transport system involved in multi-copper enzyme maturation permease subunit
MVGLIAIKELRNNIVAPSFIVGLALCLVLIPYTVYTGIQTYENRLAQYETDVKAAEDVYQKSQVYAQVNPLVVKPVSPLIIFSKGISEQTGSKVKLDRKEKPVFSSDIVTLNENPFMGNFMSLDFTTALTILLSLLGILFSYDMLSREKEQGTLKLALSQSVSRSTFFLGKIAGIFLTLAPILIICFLVILLIIQFAPSLRFSASDYGRIGMLTLMSFVYFAFFVFLGGFISSRTKSSTISIILNLFIWCFLLFLLPNAATYLGKNITPTDDYKQLQYNTEQIDSEFWDAQYGEIEKTLQEENLHLEGWFICSGHDWDGGYMIAFTPKPNMEYERRKKELMNPVLLNNCDKKWAIQSDYLQQVYRQEKTIRYLSCLSPSGIFRQVAASLCHTGMDSEVHFMNQVRQFQNVYYDYFLQNRIFSSYLYFTPQKEVDFPNTWEEASAKFKKWKSEIEQKTTFSYSAFGYLDTSGLPQFTYVQPTIGNDLYSQLYLSAGILIICILLFWFSFISFIKYDVR